MYTARLRKVGGSVMLAVPPVLLDALDLKAGAAVGLNVEKKRLVIQSAKPRYTLDALLSQCDPSAEISSDDRQWLDAPAVGRELI